MDWRMKPPATRSTVVSEATMSRSVPYHLRASGVLENSSNSKRLLCQYRHVRDAFKYLARRYFRPPAFVLNLSAPCTHIEILCAIFPELADIHIETSKLG